MTTTARAHYTFGAVVNRPVEETRQLVTDALRDEGFGILTEIDVRATLKEKLGIDREPYLILGACNPGLAHRALEAEPSLGAMLPCNVVLRAEDDRTRVEILDPIAALGVASSPDVEPVALEAQERLRRVVGVVEAAAR